MTQAEWLISRWEKLKSEGEKMSWDDIISITKLSLELPQQEISDEEIEKAADKYCWNESRFTIDFFVEGAKWYREQLKNK